MISPIIKENWHDPSGLYQVIVQAFSVNIFHPQVLKAAQQLHKIDSNPARGTTMLVICYLEMGQLDQAQQILTAYMEHHGEDNTMILTLLAKVHYKQGHSDKAHEVLVRALAADPNDVNALELYANMAHDKEGSSTAALQEIAANPTSWRAQIWLAGKCLEQGGNNNLSMAREHYQQSLSRAVDPVDTLALQQISGDLGRKGHLQTLIDLVEPRFDVQVHGLAVGNNLIKAHTEMGNFQEAKRLVDKLRAMEQPEWKGALDHWDRVFAQA